jgi:hypothetical protein
MGDEDYKIVSARNLDEAITEAWVLACETFDGYAGMHGIREIEEIMEEERVSEKDAEMIYQDERESYLDYEAKSITKGL